MNDELDLGQVALTVVASLLTVAFALWAKRLDKALDLLEKIQADMHSWAKETEHRLTKLEEHVRLSKEDWDDA